MYTKTLHFLWRYFKFGSLKFLKKHSYQRRAQYHQPNRSRINRRRNFRETFLSKHMVEILMKNIFFKLQVKTNAGLVKKAIQLGFVQG